MGCLAALGKLYSGYPIRRVPSFLRATNELNVRRGTGHECLGTIGAAVSDVGCELLAAPPMRFVTLFTK